RQIGHQGWCLRGAVHGARQGEGFGPDAEQARTSSEIVGADSGPGDSASSTCARTRSAGCQIVGNTTQGKIRVTLSEMLFWNKIKGGKVVGKRYQKKK